MIYVTEFRVDGYTRIGHVELDTDSKTCFIPAYATTWNTDLLFAYKNEYELFNFVLNLLTKNYRSQMRALDVEDYMGFMLPDLSFVYFKDMRCFHVH